jgi:MFS family permease
VAGADVRRFSVDRRGTALSFVLGAAHGALLTLADTLLFPTLVLSLFVAQLTNDPVRIALVPVIGTTAWLLPPVLLGPLLERSRRQSPWAVGAAVVQTAAIVLLAYVGYRSDLSDQQRLRSFYICYLAFSLASGLASVPSRALITRAIAADRRRQYVRQRNLWGAVLAIGAGIVVRSELGKDGPDFPRNFAYLFVAAAAALTAGAFFQMRMRETSRVAPAPPPPRDGARAALRAAADASLRRYLLFRALLALSTLADPFFVVYAQRELNVPMGYVGTYLIGLTVACYLSGALWSWIARRGGHRAVLQTAALIRLAAPLIALILPYVADSRLYQDRFDDNRPIFYAFGFVFVAFGAVLGGQALGNFGYLGDIAPPTARASFSRLTNAVMAVASLAPIAGAKVVDRYGYDTLFVSAAAIGLAAIFASGILTEAHTRTRPVAQAWRLRGARS